MTDIAASMRDAAEHNRHYETLRIKCLEGAAEIEQLRCDISVARGNFHTTTEIRKLSAEIERLRADYDFMRHYMADILRCPVNGIERIGDCQQCGCTAGLLIKGHDEQDVNK